MTTITLIQFVLRIKTTERYLKHIIVNTIDENESDYLEYQKALHSHSIRKIVKFIQTWAPDISINAGTLKLADGYYFDTQYPGERSFVATYNDAQEVWEAMEHTREIAKSV